MVAEIAVDKGGGAVTARGLTEAGYVVAIVNPPQVRDFAKGAGLIDDIATRRPYECGKTMR